MSCLVCYTIPDVLSGTVWLSIRKVEGEKWRVASWTAFPSFSKYLSSFSIIRCSALVAYKCWTNRIKARHEWLCLFCFTPCMPFFLLSLSFAELDLVFQQAAVFDLIFQLVVILDPVFQPAAVLDRVFQLAAILDLVIPWAVMLDIVW